MIIIMGLIKVDPALAEDAVADLRAGMARSHAEEGCLFYDFALADKAAGQILVAERWRDTECLKKHLSTPEIAQLVGKWHGKLDSSGVRMYDASGEREVGV